MNSLDFEKALIDVRKAYRLLFLYQKRVMELVQFLGDSLSFSYGGGYSWFSENTPRSGKGSLDNYPWDWLNMYYYEFNFTTKEVSGNKFKFSILLQSDTGYYDSDSDNALDIKSFLPVEESQTRLIFLIGKNCWHPDYSSDFEDDAFFHKKLFTEYVKVDNDKSLLSKSFFLKDFGNLESSQKSLSTWIEFCKNNGVLEIDMIR